MSVAPQPLDVARLDRALDRLADHCELVDRITTHIEQRRVVVRSRLEQELGPELTHALLASLAPARL